MILIFVLGYLCIALEHKLRIDKAAIALLNTICMESISLKRTLMVVRSVSAA